MPNKWRRHRVAWRDDHALTLHDPLAGRDNSHAGHYNALAAL